MTDHLGPVDYVVVEFADPTAILPGLQRLLTLVESGRIQVLDLEFITNSDGGPRTVAAADLGADFAEFEGAASGLLDRDDLAAVAADLAPAAIAAVLVYEELTILEVFEAWEAAGAAIVSEGPVDVDDIAVALEGS